MNIQSIFSGCKSPYKYGVTNYKLVTAPLYYALIPRYGQTPPPIHTPTPTGPILRQILLAIEIAGFRILGDGSR